MNKTKYFVHGSTSALIVMQLKLENKVMKWSKQKSK